MQLFWKKSLIFFKNLKKWQPSCIFVNIDRGVKTLIEPSENIANYSEGSII